MIHICQSDTIPGLEAEVNRMFDFTPIGGVCADSGNFYLAMMHVAQPSQVPVRRIRGVSAGGPAKSADGGGSIGISHGYTHGYTHPDSLPHSGED
jgi:hypothetical protein